MPDLPDTIDREFDGSSSHTPPPELVEPVREAPPPELVDAVVRYYDEERSTLLRKVANLETLLGFIRDDAQPLSVRVSRLEAFCGVKG